MRAGPGPPRVRREPRPCVSSRRRCGWHGGPEQRLVRPNEAADGRIAIKDRGREWEAGSPGTVGPAGQDRSSACARPISFRFPSSPSSRASRSRSSARSSARTNPTLATIWRLSQALTSRSKRVLATSADEPLHRGDAAAATPILVSDDGKVKLAIVDWIKTVRVAPMVRRATAEPGGVSDAERATSAELGRMLRTVNPDIEVERPCASTAPRRPGRHASVTVAIANHARAAFQESPAARAWVRILKAA